MRTPYLRSRRARPAGSRLRAVRRRAKRGPLLPLAAALVTSLAACSPIYVIRAGIAEAKILAARQPIPEVILDPATPPATRDKLTLVREARRFAIDSIGLDTGDSYTSFTRLESDTLALVLSGAHRDRLEAKTWWFPIVGHVPYRGYFDADDALEAEGKLRKDGFDTWLRPTAAFSTLGWFADPLLSTLLRYDAVDLVETVLHELSHNHLFVGGHVRFNESFATFTGRVAAAEFFCRRAGGGPDTVKCQRAQARWRDARRFSRFLDGLVADLQDVYRDPTLDYEAKLARREDAFAAAVQRFATELRPELESLTFGSFVTTPLNNATLLSRMRYYHRLDDFHTLYEREGSLRAALAAITQGVERVDDPFDVLPLSAASGAHDLHPPTGP